MSKPRHTQEYNNHIVNSKEMKAFHWITALMTSYSRQINNGTPVQAVINDMKENFDPRGSYVIPDGSGRKVHSIIHHMGLILEEHIKNQ